MVKGRDEQSLGSLGVSQKNMVLSIQHPLCPYTGMKGFLIKLKKVTQAKNETWEVPRRRRECLRKSVEVKFKRTI